MEAGSDLQVAGVIQACVHPALNLMLLNTTSRGQCLSGASGE